MSLTQTEDGTVIPKTSFALVFSETGKMETIVPPMDADAPLTNGHILIIGLARKLQDADWTNLLIGETGEMLQKAHDLVQALDESTEKV